MPQTLKVEYDMEEMFLGIKDAIKSELGKDLAEEIKNELKAEMRAQLFVKTKEAIEDNTYGIIQAMVQDIYDTEKVSVGGGWKEEAKEYTLREYVIEQVKNAIINNTCDNSKKGYSKTSFSEWFVGKCVDPEIQRIIDKEISAIRNDVNFKVKTMFDDTTRKMLSDAVLNVLVANDIYKKMQNNIACIASRE